MNLKFCLIIPIYRHAAQFQKLLPKLLKFQIPLIVINDGNEEEETKILKNILNLENAFYLENNSNQGKGYSVYQGLKYAKLNDFTHAIQIDADGQHHVEDIPKFIELSRANPDCLILGCPIFDSTAPKVRVWGRKITNWLVAFETFSLSAKDLLFGFRVYPIESTLSFCKENDIQNRMGFEVDVVVKLMRNGVKVKNILTKVSYPKDGVSNFRYFEDNFEMIKLHFRIIFGMFMLPIKKLVKYFY